MNLPDDQTLIPEQVAVDILPDPLGGPALPAGPVRSTQEANVSFPASQIDRVWQPAYLERLAAAYWGYLNKFSLGLIRVIYEDHARTIVLGTKHLPLLRFRSPEYEFSRGMAMVTWPIDRGLLVAAKGRGSLRITVRRLDDEGSRARIRVRADVSNFYPFLRGPLAISRLGARFYNATQLRIHIWVTHGFFRSLETGELPFSKIGALADRALDIPKRD